MTNILKVKIRVILLISLFLFISIPQISFGHSSIMKATPDPDSVLETAPTEINLLFNERFEKKLYGIKVFNEDGKSITKNKATISGDQRELKLTLPEMDKGIYLVTYHIISADGHPISSSHIFSVGKEVILNKSMIVPQDEAQGLDIQDGLVFWGLRLLYYFALLLVIGWVFWGLFIKWKSEEAHETYLKWSKNFMIFYTMNFIAMVTVQYVLLVKNFNGESIQQIVVGTQLGHIWIASLCMIILGFIFLHRWKWINFLWVILLIFLKSINGHAIAIVPPLRTVLLDIVHLFAAVTWVGGLAIIIIYWRRDRQFTHEFIPLFSRAAFTSMIVLTMSGTLITLLYVPKLKFFFHTSWGILLSVKIGAVLLVLVVGGVIRYCIKRKLVERLYLWIKIDFSLMIVIVAIVGFISYSSPFLINKPYYWHEIDQNHLTLQITPNEPGKNQFSLSFSKEKTLPPIKEAELRLKYLDNPEIAPIEIPLKDALNQQTSEEISDSNKYKYFSEGAYLALSGRWSIEVRVRDINDEEQVYTNVMMIY